MTNDMTNVFSANYYITNEGQGHHFTALTFFYSFFLFYSCCYIFLHVVPYQNTYKTMLVKHT